MMEPKITKTDVKYTIGILSRAGKRFPKMAWETAPDISGIIDTWYSAFRDISLPVWQRATRIAATMTDARNIDLNTINTVLMSESIKRAQNEQFEIERKKDRELKQADQKADPFDKSTQNPDRVVRIAARWTRRRLKKKQLPFNVPGEEAAWQYGRKLGMTGDEIKKQNLLIRIYLADVDYCKQSGMKPGYEIFIGPDRLLHSRIMAI